MYDFSDTMYQRTINVINKFKLNLQSVVVLSAWLFIKYVNGYCKSEDVSLYCRRPFLICVWIFSVLAKMPDFIMLFSLYCPFFCANAAIKTLFLISHVMPLVCFHGKSLICFWDSNSNMKIVVSQLKTDVFLRRAVIVHPFCTLIV